MALPEKFISYNDFFESCINFLKNYQWMYNFANTELFVQNVLDNFPTEWKSTFNSMTFEQLCLIPVGYSNESWPSSLKQFFDELNALKPTFANEILTEFTTSNDEYCAEDLNYHAVGMSKKKQHEVANLVAQIQKCCDDVNIVIDVGSGLGYLSQYLHAKHGFYVLGIEANERNVRSAQSRQSKWFSNSSNHVRYVQHRITSNTSPEIYKYLKSTEWDLSRGVCMVGLHTCGDLISSTIDIFLMSDYIKMIAVMPCCYHKMQFEKVEGAEIFRNFPSSGTLKHNWKSAKCESFLRRPFLRLACQQRPDAWKNFDGKELETRVFRLLSRATLEFYVKQENLTLIKNKRKIAKANNCDIKFETFLKDIESGYTIKHLSQNKEDALQDFDKHSTRLNELWRTKCDEPFNIRLLTGTLLVLQACLQPVCENLLLLDKIKRLNDSNINIKSKFVKIADEALSARCFCLLSSKK